MHDIATCPLCSALPTSGSLSDDEFYSFLAACRQDLAIKQDRFQKRIAGETQWSYAMEDASLTIGKQRFGMTLIGTFNTQQSSWMWAWANEDFPANVVDASKRLQELHTLTGFRVFLMPALPASEMDALAFTALAVHWLGAIGFFRCPGAEPTLHLAVHE